MAVNLTNRIKALTVASPEVGLSFYLLTGMCED